MDLAGAEFEGNFVVGQDPWETLRDVADGGDRRGIAPGPCSRRRCRSLYVTHHSTLHRPRRPIGDGAAECMALQLCRRAYCGASVTEVMSARTLSASHTGS